MHVAKLGHLAAIPTRAYGVLRETATGYIETVTSVATWSKIRLTKNDGLVVIGWTELSLRKGGALSVGDTEDLVLGANERYRSALLKSDTCRRRRACCAHQRRSCTDQEWSKYGCLGSPLAYCSWRRRFDTIFAVDLVRDGLHTGHTAKFRGPGRRTAEMASAAQTHLPCRVRRSLWRWQGWGLGNRERCMRIDFPFSHFFLIYSWARPCATAVIWVYQTRNRNRFSGLNNFLDRLS